MIQSTYHNDIQYRLIHTISQQLLSLCPEDTYSDDVQNVVIQNVVHCVVGNCNFCPQNFKINIFMSVFTSI